MTTFSEWFEGNLADYAEDISSHGADAGYPYITYTSDCVDLYNEFEDEIYENLRNDAEEFGYDSIDSFVGSFARKDMLETPDQRKNLLVWYMAEKCAHLLAE